MRIRQLQFYRYGHFSDVSFDLPANGLQVLFGENEAGKSTMMQFIREILFGFSAQSPGIKDSSAVYGGTLTIEFPEHGTVRVERTGIKGTGKLKMYLPGGETAGEDALREWLPGLDEAMFRAVFCFDLDGLQRLEKVKAEEVNDYLFHAGMTGDFSIRELEKDLHKKQEALFKPQGRNPKLNKMLSELEHLEKEVSVWEHNNESYRELLDQSRKIDERLSEIQAQREKGKAELRKLEHRKALIPYVRECKELEFRIEQLKENGDAFPEDGLSRYEQWRSQAVTLEAELDELKARRDSELEKASKIEIKRDWTRLKEALQREREREPFVQNRRSELAAAQQTVETEEEELDVLMEQLGPQWTREQAVAADTSFTARESLKKLIDSLTSARQKWGMLNEERVRKERLVRESESELAQAKKERLPESERAEYERKLDAYEAQYSMQGKAQNWPKEWSYVLYGGTAFAAGLAVWLILSGQWLAGAAACIFAGMMIYYFISFVKKSKRSGASIEREVSVQDVERAKLSLEKDQTAKSSESLSADRLAQRETALAEVVEQMEEVRQQLKKMEKAMVDWKERYQFISDDISEKWFEIFQRVEEVKTRIRKRNRASALCQIIKDENEERAIRIQEWCQSFGISFESEASALARMSEKLAEQEKLSRKREQHKESASACEEQMASLQVKINRYQKECDELLNQANAGDEEDFRSKAKAFGELQRTGERLAEVRARLKALGSDEKEWNEAAEAIRTGADLDEEMRHLEGRMERLEDEMQALYEQAAKVQEQRKSLEEGGTYAEFLHAFELKKSEFNEAARKWAVYRTAEHLLQKAKEQYRGKRLPAVIKAASRRFERMTEGRYPEVYAPADEGFVVERKDGVRLKPEQLSRGTREQLYMALRLALASIYQAPSSYPFIMDDVLVNFDESRTKQAIRAIREAADQHQMLLFTCHEHLLNCFQGKEIVSVQQDHTMI